MVTKASTNTATNAYTTARATLRRGLGYSARSAKEWDRALDALDAFDLIETSADHVRRARQVQRLLAAKHQRRRKVPDLLVAAAEANNLAVLHYDTDFDRIAAVTGQGVEWVVPARSVDCSSAVPSEHPVQAGDNALDFSSIDQHGERSR